MLPLARRGRLRGGLLVLGIAVVTAGACASDEADFGPMAVVGYSGTGMAREAFGGSGPIDIGERCVTLTREDGPVTLQLVWRSNEVTWDEEDRAITFVSSATQDPTPVTIRDGDVIAIGGASFDRLYPKIPWLAEPDESCEGDSWWSVESLSLGPTPTR